MAKLKPPGALQVERLENGDRKLLRELVIDLEVDLGVGTGKYPGLSMSDDDTTLITVPEGFDTDFSSIPRLARAFFRFDAVDLAGCCHDFAYRIGIPRGIADEIWRLVAISGTRHVDKTRGRVGWLALRLFGGWAYRNRTRERLAT